MTCAKRHNQQVSLLARVSNHCSSCSASGPSTSKQRHARRKSQQRNPFFRFLQHYRAQQHRGKMSAYKSSTKAARMWNRMTIKQKCPYIEAAVAARYVYKSRNANVNRILDLLHYVLPDGENIKPEHLPCVTRALRKWQFEQLAQLF